MEAKQLLSSIALIELFGMGIAFLGGGLFFAIQGGWSFDGFEGMSLVLIGVGIFLIAGGIYEVYKRKTTNLTPVNKIKRGNEDNFTLVVWYFKILGILIVLFSLFIGLIDKTVLEGTSLSILTNPFMAGVLVLVGVLFFVIGNGLSQYKPWARIAAIIVSVLESGRALFMGGFISLLISVGIIYYLCKEETQSKFV